MSDEPNKPLPEPAPVSPDSTASSVPAANPPCDDADDPEAREKQCDREFAHYYEERKEWVKAQLESERRYDTLLTSICTLALGATLLKDFVNRGGVAGTIFLLLAWMGFGVGLVVSLLHQYLTYETHRRWLDVVDNEFSNWQPNAMARALGQYDNIPFVKRVESLKVWAGGAVLAGILFSFAYLVATVGASAAPDQQSSHSETAQPSSQVVNVFTADSANGQQRPLPSPATQPTAP